MRARRRAFDGCQGSETLGMPTSCFVLHCVASFHSAPPTLSFPLYNPPLLLLCPLSTGLRSSTCSLSFPTPFIPSQRSICASHYDTPVSINTLNCEPVHHQTLSTTTCFQQHQLTQQTHRKNEVLSDSRLRPLRHLRRCCAFQARPCHQD